jgi:hypothetical protein
MIRVKAVWQCDRCSLQWIADTPPDTCPKCVRHFSGPVTIRLAGRDIEISSVRLYGDNPLKKAATGLDSLRLGIRCPHNWIAPHLCPECG